MATFVDPAIVAAACDGVTTVISMIGRHFAETAKGLWAVDAEGNEALIVAASIAGVGRFVWLSAHFADRDYPPIRLAAKRHAENAYRLEDGIRDRAYLPDVHARCGQPRRRGRTVDRTLGPRRSFPRQNRCRSSCVDAADALAAALDTDPARVVDLGGPDALTMDEGDGASPQCSASASGSCAFRVGSCR